MSDSCVPSAECKPCLDSWLLFQSNCYLFTDSDYSRWWKTWQGSRDRCRENNADLVVIDSQEEQARLVQFGPIATFSGCSMSEATKSVKRKVVS